jgi:hypothetical protein
MTPGSETFLVRLSWKQMVMGVKFGPERKVVIILSVIWEMRFSGFVLQSGIGLGNAQARQRKSLRVPKKCLACFVIMDRSLYCKRLSLANTYEYCSVQGENQDVLDED